MEKLLADNITSFMEDVALLTSKTEVLDSVNVTLLQRTLLESVVEVLNSVNVSLLNDNVQTFLVSSRVTYSTKYLSDTGKLHGKDL